MRVCIISKQDPCSPGGIESVVYGILCDLERTGKHELTVTYYGNGKDSSHKWTSVRYRQVRPKQLSPLVYGAIVGLEVCREGHEVVNTHAEGGFGFGLAHRIFDRKHKTRHVQTFHGLSWYAIASYQKELTGLPRLLSYIYRPIVGLAEGIAAWTADINVVVSEGVAQELVDLYMVDRSRIRVVHNCVDTELYRPRDRSGAQMRLKLASTAGPYLLYMGREHIRKGMLTAIMVTEALRAEGQDATLLVGGMSADQLPPYARRDFVKAMGRVSEEDLPYLYNAVSLLLHPSRYEGHPITPLEALASGTPVVASNSSKIEISPNPALRIVSSGLVQDYVRNIQELLAQEPGFLASEARRLVEGGQVTYAEYLRIFQDG